jgi:hypothetical protein
LGAGRVGAHRTRIEQHLKERLGTLFDLEYDLLLYDVTSTYFEGQCAANGLAKRNDRWSDWAALSEGCYLLRTNLNETDPAVLWKRYIQLTDAEWAFRITKDELEIRPIWHQKTDRVLAHILICFLAYVLWKTLAQWMRRSGLGDAPRTLLEELAKIKSGDVLLPTGTKDGRHNGAVRLRCVTEPDAAHKVLLHRLGVPLPRRLKRIDEFVQM